MIRNVLEEDVKSVYNIADEAFSDNWTYDSFMSFVKMPQAIFKVAIADDNIVGYAIATFAADQANLDDIAVLSSYRRSGVAQSLLDSVICSLRERDVDEIFLEVRESNAGALAFYEKNSFDVIGRRSDFYRDPTEDALIMSARIA